MFKFVLVIQKLGFCLTVHYCYKKIVLLRTLSQNLSRLFHCSVIKVLCSCRSCEAAFVLYQSRYRLSRTFLIIFLLFFSTFLFSRLRQLVNNIMWFHICQQVFTIFLKNFFNSFSLRNHKRRRGDLNPRAAVNDLHPFQGCPFGQLGYFSMLCPNHSFGI